MTTLSATSGSHSLRVWKPVLFFIVLFAGLWYVKWDPYYAKAWVARQNHAIGASIIGDSATNPWNAAWHYAQAYFLAVWKAAVLGVILGSLVQVLIPRAWLQRTLGDGRLKGTLLGTIFALPGMMCTCCAAPLVAGMRRQQTSMGASLAFWLANPVLNPATLVFMGFVLGWHFALLRLGAGLIMVVGIALAVQRWVKEPALAPLPDAATAAPAASGPLLGRWLRAMWSLFWSTIPIYVVAVLIVGAARVWWFPQLDGAVANSLLWVVMMAVVGALFVIPTAAEIPIVQTMMLAGMGTAPALALLMTLPAVSLPSLLMLRKAFPAKALWLTLLGVIVTGIVVGSLALR